MMMQLPIGGRKTVWLTHRKELASQIMKNKYSDKRELIERELG